MGQQRFTTLPGRARLEDHHGHSDSLRRPLARDDGWRPRPLDGFWITALREDVDLLGHEGVLPLPEDVGLLKRGPRLVLLVPARCRLRAEHGLFLNDVDAGKERRRDDVSERVGIAGDKSRLLKGRLNGVQDLHHGRIHFREVRHHHELDKVEPLLRLQFSSQKWCKFRVLGDRFLKLLCGLFVLATSDELLDLVGLADPVAEGEACNLPEAAVEHLDERVDGLFLLCRVELGVGVLFGEVVHNVFRIADDVVTVFHARHGHLRLDRDERGFVILHQAFDVDVCMGHVRHAVLLDGDTGNHAADARVRRVARYGRCGSHACGLAFTCLAPRCTAHLVTVAVAHRLSLHSLLLYTAQSGIIT